MTEAERNPSAGNTPQLSDYAQHVSAGGDRPLASLIHFLLPAGDASAWHVVDADELWLWHGPGAVTLELGGTGRQPAERGARRVTLRVDTDGTCGEAIVPAGVWQRTIPSNEDALVSCVVSPGFTFAGFKLASQD